MALDPDPKPLFNGTVNSAGLATQYTASTTERVRINEIIIANGASATRTISLHLVASGDSADSTNLYWPKMDIPEAIPSIFPMNTWLAEGDLIVASVDGASVTMYISGMEKTTV